MFFAHVRAATGTATSRANCHPFGVGRHLFMHNGQIGGYQAVRRRLEMLIPDELYNARAGTTDTEVLFLIALANGLEHDPIQAMAKTIGLTLIEMQRANVSEALRLTAALTDGDTIWAFRWASDMAPATLYHRRSATHSIVVSEPIDEHRHDWLEVPPNKVLVARHGHSGRLHDFNPSAMAQD
jgi:glutamine amidotransferase